MQRNEQLRNELLRRQSNSCCPDTSKWTAFDWLMCNWALDSCCDNNSNECNCASDCCTNTNCDCDCDCGGDTI